ncbi:MAG TPA: M23 family metallopeptidase [Burkholderiales bacterium]|nr:M23 family metallopeptidase [Burkholderiales bacterium]
MTVLHVRTGTLAIACVFTASAAWAGINDYPLRIAIEMQGATKALVAHNDGASPVTLHLDGAPSDTGDGADGKTFVVEARSATILADVSNAEGATLHYSFYVGRINAAPERGRCYRLPFREGHAFRVSQAYGDGNTTHDNEQNRYAVDFAMPEGTPVVAARAGIVVDVTLRHHASGRDPSLLGKANRVTIVHDDGTIAKYAHLAPELPRVSPGEKVEAGALIGHSGNTGYSSGPHLHFVVGRPALVDGKVKPISLPFCFYTGTPPVVFAPAVGMMPVAHYPQPAAEPEVRAASGAAAPLY